MSSILTRFLPILLVAIAFAMTMTTFTPTSAAAASTATSQVCGSIDLGATNNDDDARTFDCFNTAFRNCAPAQLNVTGRDGNADVAWVFVTVPADQGCRVWAIVERGAGSAQTTDSYSCAQLRRDKDALHVNGCGTLGDVTLLPRSTLGSGPAAAAPSQPR